jgi:NAD(P)-dependent dehydrogenase (short-subunit alcohol dehydrogenase family)
MTTSSRKSVLLIGASRGLGLAMAREYVERGWQVTGTVRGSGRTGLHDLSERSSGQFQIEMVDINVPDQVLALHQRLESRIFDLLFVDAGVTNGPHETIADVSTEEFTRLMVTNALSPMRVLETLQGLVPAHGTLGVMSSGQGVSRTTTAAALRSTGPAKRPSTRSCAASPPVTPMTRGRWC